MKQTTEPVFALGTGELVGFKVFIPVENEENTRLEALSAFERLVSAFCDELSQNGWDFQVQQIKDELSKPRTKIPSFKVVEGP